MILNEYSTWMDVIRFAGSRGDKSWTYIITGRPGPTGKTHLYNMLKKNGYNAYEISEDMINLVDYQDNRNHYKIDYAKKQTLIVLNKRLSLKELGKSLYDNNPHAINYDLLPSPGFVTYPEIESNVIKMFMTCNEIIPLSQQKLKPQIKNVIFNDPATIVFWSDGTKTVVKTQEGEEFDPEKGLAMAISKKALGNKREYYHTFLHWLKEYDRKYYWKNKEFCKEYDPVQLAYDILVKCRDHKVDFDIDDIIGYLGEALEG